MHPIFKALTTMAIATTALTAPAMADPVYMIAQIQIEDHTAFFEEYGAAAGPQVLGNGGRVLVASPTVDTLEGAWSGNWTVVIEFPSEEAAKQGWYNSDAYQQAIDLRIASTSLNNMVLAPAFVPPAE
ncbi:DUF1330 domain-containing protein [Alphaproteobacteria bacterium GH1-50]|uniref:DUF1330 domain-containing protein n=1 Tax=Kangsaoukella pontilimi TaxID=2691042 RepID=A0A7C9MBZ9_9RHOB|nr:DUF1330 domain-containing protein [Kangsaoukella pontilimi]MXQ09033.1 DUF1330 domain-containing protein [Kangsaoukella pontilimi]